jgi:hypothetical protein
MLDYKRVSGLPCGKVIINVKQISTYFCDSSTKQYPLTLAAL